MQAGFDFHLAGSCSQYFYAFYLERWARRAPAAKTLVVMEEPWSEVKTALRGFFGVNTELPEPQGHSSDRTEPWPVPPGMRPLTAYFAADYARVPAVLREFGFRTVAAYL